jgi:hypothetical protein
MRYPYSYDKGSRQISNNLDAVEVLVQSNGRFSSPVNETSRVFMKNNGNVVFFNVSNRIFVWENFTIDTIEDSDLLKFSSENGLVQAWFNVQQTSRLLAGMDLLVLCVIIGLLVIGNVLDILSLFQGIFSL